MRTVTSHITRTAAALALPAVLLAGAVIPAAATAARSKPLIKAEEVGYFGNGDSTRTVTVFVYSNLGPSAGNRVRVCVKGTCKRARGPNARLAWYDATFVTRRVDMGAPLRFTIVASDSAGKSTVTVTQQILCIHNNGHTPED
jgi:hypothetical protein